MVIQGAKGWAAWRGVWRNAREWRMGWMRGLGFAETGYARFQAAFWGRCVVLLVFSAVFLCWRKFFARWGNWGC